MGLGGVGETRQVQVTEIQTTGTLLLLNFNNLFLNN